MTDTDVFSDTRILSELIKETALLQVSPGRSIELREEQAEDSAVTVSNMPNDVVIIKTDKFESPGSIFNNSKRECKRSDYVIISEKRKRIVYIELKQSSGKHTTQQLTGAKCFIAYCKEIGKGFWEKSSFLDDYQERFVVFLQTRNSKKTQNFYKISESAGDTPAKPIKCFGVNQIQFKQIAG